jgi:hypothetical protein
MRWGRWAWDGAGRGPLVGQDLGQAADEVLQGPAAGPPVALGVEDVDAALGQPPHERDLGLELGALGLHGRHLVDRAVGEALEVARIEDAVQAALLRHVTPVRWDERACDPPGYLRIRPDQQ